MIEMDESEYLNSTVSDCTLRAVALLFDHETKDKLLYRGDSYYRLTGSHTSISERGRDLVECNSNHTSDIEDQGQPAQKARERPTG